VSTFAQSGPTLVAGLLPRDRARERYPVAPGGATVVELEGDDRVRVLDPGGGQVAELTALGAGGREDPRALGLRADAPASVLAGLRPGDGGGFLAALARRGLDPHDARAARLGGADGAPGGAHELLAQRAVTLIVASPGGRVVDGELPASELVVEVHRANPCPRAPVDLPAPLAEPRLDLHIDAATARSYEVRAGEYIQVIDVAGKQCSDFLAFHARKLAAGHERGLDATVTRTLMGRAFPAPGLQGKFYDQDLEPLVEVVRDTVGRHDTFVLAFARHAITRISATRATSTAPTTSTVPSSALRSRRAVAGRRSTSSTTRRSAAIISWSPTSRGPGRATT